MDHSLQLTLAHARDVLIGAAEFAVHSLSVDERPMSEEAAERSRSRASKDVASISLQQLSIYKFQTL